MTRGRERIREREGDAGVYPQRALDCKPLQLPPPLAVFFLIASWAISGSLFKWEVGGSECSEGGWRGVCVRGGLCLAQPKQ